MKKIKTFENFIGNSLSESRLVKQEMTREGELFVSWLEKTMKGGTIKSIELKNNSATVSIHAGMDLTDDVFRLVNNFVKSPSELGLYIDAMYVNQGKLMIIFFTNPGIKLHI